MTRKEMAALALLAAVWGGSYLFIRVAVPAFGPAPLMAARVALAAAILAAVARARGVRLDLRRHARHLLVLGAANAALPFTLIAAAELHLTASLAAILTATVPMFSVLLGAVWLREPVGTARAAGLALGLAGVAVLVGWSPVPATATVMWSVAAVLAASFSYAFASFYAKRQFAGVPPLTLALGQQLGALAWLLVPALFTLPHAVPPLGAVAALLGLATVSTAVAYLLFFYLIERIGPTRTPTVTYLIPVFGTLWGAAFLHERLTPGMLVGLAAVLASVMLVNGVRLPILRRRAAAAAEC